MKHWSVQPIHKACAQAHRALGKSSWNRSRTTLHALHQRLVASGLPAEGVRGLARTIDFLPHDARHHASVYRGASAYLQSMFLGEHGDLAQLHQHMASRFARRCPAAVHMAAVYPSDQEYAGYEIGESIGHQVVRARDVVFGGEAVIKQSFRYRLKLGLLPLGGFFDEMRFLSVLGPDIAPRLHRVGVTGRGKYWCAMDWLRGGDARQACNNPDFAYRMQVGRRMVALVAKLHVADIIHRDIKPANMGFADWQRSPGALRLLDFSTTVYASEIVGREAKLVVGTPGYMPEGFAGEIANTKRQDVYALGSSLWRLLSGAKMNVGKEEEVQKPRPISDGQIAAQIPPVFQPIIRRALLRDGEQGFADAKEMLQAYDLAMARLHAVQPAA